MYIASAKRKENIAEYLLYMWQIEDIIRAYGLDIEKIKESVIDPQTQLDDNQKKQLTEWYESLIDMMRREDVAKSGHLQLNKNVLTQLVELHSALLKDPRFPNTLKNSMRHCLISSNLEAKRAKIAKARSKRASTLSTVCSCSV